VFLVPLDPDAVDQLIHQELIGLRKVVIQRFQLSLQKVNAVLKLFLRVHNHSLMNPDGMVSGFLKKYSSFLIRNLTRSDLFRW